MRNAATMIVALALVAGCGKHVANETVALETMAKGLNEAWPQPSWVLQMTMSLTRNSGREFLACRLTNVSASTLQIDSSRLPWITPNLISFTFVTAKGKISRNAVMGGLANEPKPILIASGQTLEGDIDVLHTAIARIDRGEDLLVLWTYNADEIAGYPPLSGATFFPKH